MKWLIANNDDATKALAMHGWTRDRRQALIFASEFEAQAWIDSRRAAGHTARATEADLGAYPGTPGAMTSEYEPYGFNRAGRAS